MLTLDESTFNRGGLPLNLKRDAPSLSINQGFFQSESTYKEPTLESLQGGMASACCTGAWPPLGKCDIMGY